MLNVAVEWGVIDKPPVRLKLLRKAQPRFRFYDVEELDRLVLAAERLDKPNVLLTVLLGGEAGFRCVEIRPLRWSGVDLKLGTLTVCRGIWREHEGPPKGGRIRTIPLAPRLWAALQEHRHLRSPNVLCTVGGTRPSTAAIRQWLNTAQEAAGFETTGPHVLRHTFCSHLAMAGKPPRVIQALTGHQSITTTERYMHLAQRGARGDRGPAPAFGLETCWRRTLARREISTKSTN